MPLAREFGADLFERHEIQADLPECVHYGRPLKSLVASIMDWLPTAAVLAVDREWARLFLLQQNELTEVRRKDNVRLDDGDRWDTMVAGAGRSQPGSGPRSDSGTDLFENREAAMQQRFYSRIVSELTELMTQRDVRQLILVGPVQRLAEFKAELPQKAPFELIGETNLTGGAGWVNPAEILEKIQPMLAAHREQTEQALLAEIQERGVMEIEQVLEMLQQARLYQLVISEDGAQLHVYRNNRDVPYFTGRKDVPHSPLDDSVMERVTLEDLIPDLIDLYGH
ncbi:VLRF1 family aeRF1-type release factor (plasmid) [Deinococcus taeanensis]|uniref:VLRF1 family aeRF1-type release factor n=1 Tax=Deinococcus taeanensis TaxID=2737050 RepID=UPI001CDB7C37|nr:VLRF1 family aeRF1-type release factor [Deinococcus taeanensis]UBV45075.1 VLRF1 family aeRF1-type release factor [Deinococcus taeanensis]